MPAPPTRSGVVAAQPWAGRGSPSTEAPRRRSSRGRWAFVLAVSIAVHLAFIDALPRWDTSTEGDAFDEPPLRAMIVPAPEPVPVPPPTPEPPKPAPKPRMTTPRPAAPAPAPVETAPVQTTASVDAAPAPAAPDPAPTPAPAPAPAVPSGPPPPQADAPTSARLVYKVAAIDQKNAQPTRYWGVGSIDWIVRDGRYHAELKAAVDFLFFKANVLASTSEGAIGPLGVQPDRYTETPRRRPTLATSFNRDARQSITFSASSNEVPLAAGAQDRLSILFQIGGLLRANSGFTAIDGHFDLPVAGVRGDVDPWTFTVIGDETVEAGIGNVKTVHLRRSPRPGTNDRTVDVWVALESGGYPARVLYTEPNGSTIDMTLDKLLSPGGEGS